MKRMLLYVIVFAVICFTAAVVPAEEYDLDSYLVLVERNNPDLLMLYKDIEIAKTGVTQARSVFFPSIGVQGSYNRNIIEQTQSMAVASTGNPGPLIFEDIRTNFDNELILGVGVNQVIFNPASLSNYNKAKLAQAIREQSYEAARLSILCAAKKLYFRAQLALMLVEIRESSENLSRERYQSVERRYNAGVAIELDLLMAEVDMRAKADATMEAKKNAELVLLAFRNLAGIPHSQTITLSHIYDEMPELPDTPNFGSVLANRADYRALLLARDLNDIERKASRMAFIPELTASFSYGLGLMTGNKDYNGNYDFQNAVFGINLRIPIAAGGARVARVKAAQLEREKTILAISQKETAIESELIELQLRLDEARQRFESSYQTVETARRAVSLAQSAFINGQATHLTVVDAQDRLDQTWLGFANVTYEYLSAYYDWELAVGTAR